MSDFRPRPWLGRPSVREVLERPDGRWFRAPSHGEGLVINELSVTAHALRPPSCPLVGTDLAGLRDELARTGVGGHLLAST